MGVLDYISFDLSLARGLDYYTGLIYEFVLTSPNQVGSIAAGGRYDNLVGMFSASGQQIPCVGVSMGIERIFRMLQEHAEKEGTLRKNSSQVLVASTISGKDKEKADYLERLAISQQLWASNIAAETTQQMGVKFTKQLQKALELQIPYMVVLGEEESANGELKIKILATKEEVTVKRENVVEELLKRGCPTADSRD